MIQPVVYSLINALSGKVVIRDKKVKEDLSLLALPLMMNVPGKGVTRVRRGYKNMHHMVKNV